MPLVKQEFLKLAFDLAEAMKIPHRFNKEKQAAEKHFYYDFMQKHPDISLRAPESTSLMRAVGFNKPQVDMFYDNLEKLMTQYKFPPSTFITVMTLESAACINMKRFLLRRLSVK